MKKVLYDSPLICCIFLTIFFTSGFNIAILNANVGEVTQLHSTSHIKNIPSQNPLIKVQWSKPDGQDTPDGYYTLFNQSPEHEFNEFNSADSDVNLVFGYEIISNDYTGADDFSYYFHIAAFIIDNEGTETIGNTISYGPFRIDTVPPSHVSVIAPEYSSTKTITLNIGASGASQVYISNIQYGQAGIWEDWAESKKWDLPEDRLETNIYVLFRDRALNISKSSTKVIYDNERPVVQLSTTATNPARITPIHMTAVFNELINGFDKNDIIVSNGEIINFAAHGNGSYYTSFEYDIIPVIEGNISIDILENSAIDRAGNGNKNASFNIFYDLKAIEINEINNIEINEGDVINQLDINISNPSSYSGNIFLNVLSDNQSLINNSNISINGYSNSYTTSIQSFSNKQINLSIIPESDAIGAANISIYASDQTGLSTSETFKVYVKAVSNISEIQDQSIDEDSSLNINFSITDKTGGLLNILVQPTNSELISSDSIFITATGITGSGFNYSVTTESGVRKNFLLIVTPENNKNGISNFEIIVTNAENNISSQSFSLIVKPKDDKPYISKINNQTTEESQVKFVNFIINDPDGGKLLIDANSSNESIISNNDLIISGDNIYIEQDKYYINSTAGEDYDLTLTISPLPNQHGHATIEIFIEDETNLKSSSSFAVIVSEINFPPVISDIDKKTTVEGNPIQILFQLSDPDGGLIGIKAKSSAQNLVLDENITFTGSGEYISDTYYVTTEAGNPLDLTLKINPSEDNEGTATIELTATDENFLTDTSSFELLIRDKNSSPELSSIGNQTKPEASDVVIKFSLTDADGDLITITGNSENQLIVPDTSISFEGQGLEYKDGKYILQTNPGQNHEVSILINLLENIYGKTNISIKINDEIFEDNEIFELNITEINDPPVFPDINNFTIKENLPEETIIGCIKASDPDNDPLTYTLNPYNNFSINNSDGCIKTLTVFNYEQKSEYLITVTVKDKKNTIAKNLNIFIEDVNEAPKISGNPILTVLEDQTYNFSPIIEDEDIEDINDNLNIQILNIPSWAENIENAITGIPDNDDVGVYENIYIIVSDSKGLTDSINPFNISVINVNDPPEFNLNAPVPDKKIRQSVYFEFQLPHDTFIDVDKGDVISYTATLFSDGENKALPAWLSFNPVTKKFSGRPTINDIGIIDIMVIGTDKSSASQSFNFKIEIVPYNQNPIITLSTTGINYTENYNEQFIAPLANALDNDYTNFDSGQLIVDISENSSTNDCLSIYNHGNESSFTWIDNNKVFVNKLYIASFTNDPCNKLIISFNSNAYINHIKTVLQNITYKNNSDNPLFENKKIRFILTDGDGGESAPAYVSLKINAINDNPVVLYNAAIISSDIDLEDIDEGDKIYFSSATNKRITVSDPDAGEADISFSISCLHGKLNINYVQNTGWTISEKELSFSGKILDLNNTLNSLTYEAKIFGNEIISIKVNDNSNSGYGGGILIEKTISFTVHEVNFPPQLSEINDINMIEDSPYPVQFEITDTDKDTISLFAISSKTNIVSNNNISFRSNQPVYHIGNRYLVSTSNTGSAQAFIDISPELNKFGELDITVYAGDGQYTETKTFSVTILEENDPPVCLDFNIEVSEDISKNDTLKGSDIENNILTYTIVEYPKKGEIIITNENTGEFTYNPDYNLYGNDSFTYKAYDGNLFSNIATVNINIASVQDSPIISDVSDQKTIGQKIIDFVVYDPDNDEFEVSASSSNTSILPNDNSHIKLENNGSQYKMTLITIPDLKGETYVEIKALDTEDQMSTKTFKLSAVLIDSIPPVISLNGDSVISLKRASQYEDAGASASDDIDGDITSRIISSNNLNEYKEGFYQYLYKVEDLSGNTSSILRNIIVYEQDYKTISGKITDETGKELSLIDVKAKTKNGTIKAEDKSGFSGDFILNYIPVSSELIYLEFSRHNYENLIFSYSNSEQIDNFIMIKADSPNLIKIEGTIRQYNGIWLEGAEINAFNKNNIKVAAAFTDENGEYCFGLDKRMIPYSFTVEKGGYISKSFSSSNSLDIELIKKTDLIVKMPETDLEHNIARNANVVNIEIWADYPFKGILNEIILDQKSSFDNISYDSKGFYRVRHSKYEDFSIVVKADTTENNNAASGYFNERKIVFTTIPSESDTLLYTGTIETDFSKPVVISSKDSKSDVFVSIGIDGIYEDKVIDQIEYSVRELENFNSSTIFGKIVELKLNDLTGNDIASGDDRIIKRFNLSLDMVSPVSKTALENNEYEIVVAPTLSELIQGKGEILETFYYPYEKTNTVIVTSETAGVFGFRKINVVVPVVYDSGGGGGCFINSLW